MNDAASLFSGNKPLYDNRFVYSFRIAAGDLKYEKGRLFRAAVLTNRKPARHSRDDLDRGLDTVKQLIDRDQVRAVLISHRKVVEQVLDRCVGRVRFGE